MGEATGVCYSRMHIAVRGAGEASVLVRQFGLIGWPVAHSVSPDMMNAAFAAVGVQADYRAWPVAAEDLGQAMKELHGQGLDGFNVTIPHKQAVFPLLNDWTEEARYVGAVNTVRWDDSCGGWVGHNTDMDGWWNSVKNSLPHSFRHAVVLGTGGAARAAVAALARHAAGVTVHLSGRTPEHAEVLRRDFADRVETVVCPWEKRHAAVAAAELVVQTTPVGLWPNADASPLDGSCFHAGQVVQEMVYRPLQTKLMHLAAAEGATVIDGLHMLVHQGALSFAFWLHRPAPVDVMYEAAKGAIASSVSGD